MDECLIVSKPIGGSKETVMDLDVVTKTMGEHCLSLRQLLKRPTEMQKVLRTASFTTTGIELGLVMRPFIVGVDFTNPTDTSR